MKLLLEFLGKYFAFLFDDLGVRFVGSEVQYEAPLGNILHFVFLESGDLRLPLFEIIAARFFFSFQKYPRRGKG